MSKNVALDLAVITRERKGRFILFGEIEAQSNKKWLVRNFLGEGEACAFYGVPGSGKSVLVQDMGLHIAAGQPWHGRPVEQGAVLFLALERRQLVARRAVAFRDRHGLADLPFAIAGGVFELRDQRTAIAVAEIAQEVAATTRQPMRLIIIDTLSRALCGGDENSSKDMGALVAATSILQERAGAAVLWVHHMPLDGGERMRGHGALLGALDVTVHVDKGSGVRTATVIKANDGPEGDNVAFTLDTVPLGIDEDGLETTAPVVVPVDAMACRPARKTARLPPAAQTALRALAEAIAEDGVPPTSDRIPRSIRVVTVETWRKSAYRMGISASDEPEAKRKAFRRASEQLIGAGRVGFDNDMVWIS